MTSQFLYDWIQVDEYAATPKYLQLAQSVLRGLQAGKLKAGQLLPSINELSFELEISRDTAEKGYNYLKKAGVLVSLPGKGYYLKDVEVQRTPKIFLLFNKLSRHKKIIYDSFVQALGEKATVDFYIYNNDFSLFRKMLRDALPDYSHYVIIPHFREGGEKAVEVINEIPKEKLVLLDKKIAGISGNYAAAYENFAQDIHSALQDALGQLKKYHTLKIIFPPNTYFPEEILDGFRQFCADHQFNHQVVHDIGADTIVAGDAFINLMEEDLVTLIERVLHLDLEIGKDVGIISYNEIPLKKIMLNGITTISSDFRRMGEMAAELVLTGSRSQLEVPFYLTLRGSL